MLPKKEYAKETFWGRKPQLNPHVFSLLRSPIVYENDNRLAR